MVNVLSLTRGKKVSSLHTDYCAFSNRASDFHTSGTWLRYAEVAARYGTGFSRQWLLLGAD